MTRALKEFWQREEGIASVEYAVLVAVVVVAGVAAWQGLADTIGNMLEQCTTQIANGSS